ncbi:MAG: 16S rRNA (guanine(966)-N(2))-methyltransferase RsmD [Nitratireductor sp.]|nr:16S rRNA (guanine(966)-N(2))-methyltransferase RsmD [Nitratireductor sp.]MCC0020685.1 16S rRNA (guanine(966)-N(2))-methyltransferase RsmD [Nitratireductor sp.]
MRIVGGIYRGRRLSAPSSQRVRPTTDRTRESLFNILANRFDFEGKRVIDLFAGTGALGLEAMSRGAEFCLFMDESAEGHGLVRGNIEALGLQGSTALQRRDATKPGERGAFPPFDLVFLDPPYGRNLGTRAMRALLDGGWLNADALVILEESAAEFPEGVSGFELAEKRAFGDTLIGFFTIGEDREEFSGA